MKNKDNLHINVTRRRIRGTIFLGKARNFANSHPVSTALFMQSSRSMRRIILSSVVCPNVPHKRHEFREKYYWT
jgi:hypothetical protein